MFIVHARIMKRSTRASSAGLSRTLQKLIVPGNGIEHYHIADIGTEIEATFFVLLPTVAAAEAATLNVCEKAIAWPGEDGAWVIKHCMATIVPQACDAFMLDEDSPGRPDE